MDKAAKYLKPNKLPKTRQTDGPLDLALIGNAKAVLPVAIVSLTIHIGLSLSCERALTLMGLAQVQTGRSKILIS